MVTYCGKWRGRLHHGEISRREVDEFVASCESAGWDSVAVASGDRIIAHWRRAA